MASISSSQQHFPAQSTVNGPKRTVKPFISSARFVKKAWQETRTDVSTRWPLFVLILWFGFLFNILAILIRLSIFSRSGLLHACRPDGTFSPYTGYSYWDASGLFQINLAFGSYSFTGVKIIDTVWDIVIGRLGQGILAYFAWRTFADYATVSMETTPMTYTTFTVLFTEGGPKTTSIYRFVRDVVIYRRRLRSKISTAWVIFSMLFVLAWPTLIAAMSGYSPEMGAYVKDVDENLVPYNEFRLLAYIIHDGGRINLTSDYPVPASPILPTSWDDALLSNIDGSPLPGFGFLDGSCSDAEYLTEDDLNLCHLNWNLFEYIAKYGLGGNNKTSSQWLNYTLPSNSLDIEPFVLPQHVLASLNAKHNFQPAWEYANHSYTLQDVQNNGGCQTLGESFHWGFSYVQLFIVVLLLTIWTGGTCLFRYKTQLFPPLENQPERPRGLRAILLLAEAVKAELEESGINPHTLADKKLKRQIYKNLKGGSTSFGFPLRERAISNSGNLLQWAKKDLAWLIIATAFAAFSIWLALIAYLFRLLSLVFFWALFVGTTTKSRFFLAICLSPLALIAHPSLLYAG